MNVLALLGGARPGFIGVVHLLPTAGAPRFGGSREAVLARAAADARALVDGGVDGLIVENWSIYEVFGLLTQVGAIAAPAAA